MVIEFRKLFKDKIRFMKWYGKNQNIQFKLKKYEKLLSENRK